MRDLKKNKSVTVTLYLQIHRNGCFWSKQKWFYMKQKLFTNKNGASDAKCTENPQAKNAQKIQNQKPFQIFGNTGCKS